MKNFLGTTLSVLFISAFFFAAHHVHASKYMEFLKNGYDDGQYYDHDEGPGAAKYVEGQSKNRVTYVYEKPTMSAFSYLYWAVGLYDTENNSAIDSFMRINECEMVNKYFQNDIEWKNIRDATREFLKENRDDFPTRFKFAMPIGLKNYAPKKQGYELAGNFKVEAIRRFAFYALDFKNTFCTSDRRSLYHGYPRALIVEFSRPFTLTHIPMSEKDADAFTAKINNQFRKLPAHKQSREKLQELRQAYLVFNVKFFTHGDFQTMGEGAAGYPGVEMMAVLESYEIYETAEMKNLFYSYNFMATKTSGKLNTKLKEQYKILRAKAAGDGILN